MMVNYEPALHYFGEWWKQLYGESEGKDNKGIFPAAADFSSDLHSMGQYIQEGQRILFETALLVENPRKNIERPQAFSKKYTILPKLYASSAGTITARLGT